MESGPGAPSPLRYTEGPHRHNHPTEGKAPIAVLNRVPLLSALGAVLVVAIAVSACGGSGSTPTATPSTSPTSTASVKLKNFAFEPSQLTFNVGDTVEFQLSTLDIGHTFTVGSLGINWDVSREVTRRFTFTKAGDFRLVCAIPGHEPAGMVGKITVK